MNDLKKVNPFEIAIEDTEFGVLTTLITAEGISTKNCICNKNNCLAANYIYKKDETYNLVYTIIDTNGNTESYQEDDGILPTLFKSPNGETYVSIIPYNPDKELEISIPIFDRDGIELPKGNKPFTGNFIGVSKQFSILYDVDIWSDKKADKLLAIEFKNNLIKKKQNAKVPFPRDNKIVINNNEINLLAVDGNCWLHRLIDEKGNILKTRSIAINKKYPEQILSLSFESTSYILCVEEGQFSIEIISPEAKSITKKLIDINDPIFNTWKPEKIDANTSVIIFNTEFGNGWLTIKDDHILEFFYSKAVNGYKNLLTGKVLKIESDLIISSLTKTSESAYAVIFSSTKRKKNKKIIILNRKIQ